MALYAVVLSVGLALALYGVTGFVSGIAERWWTIVLAGVVAIVAFVVARRVLDDFTARLDAERRADRELTAPQSARPGPVRIYTPLHTLKVSVPVWIATVVLLGFASERLDLNIGNAVLAGTVMAVLAAGHFVYFYMSSALWVLSWEFVFDALDDQPLLSQQALAIARRLVPYATRPLSTPYAAYVVGWARDETVALDTGRLIELLEFLQKHYPALPAEPSDATDADEREYWQFGRSLFEIIRHRQRDFAAELFSGECPVDTRQRRAERAAAAARRRAAYRARLAADDVQAALALFGLQHPIWDSARLQRRDAHLRHLHSHKLAPGPSATEVDAAGATLRDLEQTYPDLLEQERAARL